MLQWILICLDQMYSGQQHEFSSRGSSSISCATQQPLLMAGTTRSQMYWAIEQPCDGADWMTCKRCKQFAKTCFKRQRIHGLFLQLTVILRLDVYFLESMAPTDNGPIKANKRTTCQVLIRGQMTDNFADVIKR